jgi:hypothetical protein
MKDIFGKEILAGDTVVYAARRGSNTWLAHCKVVRIDENKGLVLKNVVRPKDRPFYYKCMSGLAVVEEVPSGQ